MISIIIPTLDRPQKLVKSLEKLKNTTRTHETEVIIIVDEEDKATQAILKDNSLAKNGCFIVPGHPSPVSKWNFGAKQSKGEWLVLGSDDIDWSHEWLTLSLSTPNAGFLALRDFPNSDKFYEPHYMATREWLKKNQGGVLCVPHYKHWGLDLEVAMRAHRTFTYRVSRAVLPHLHYLWGMAVNDSTYNRALPHQLIDLELYKQREKDGFLDDYEGYL